jgi:hypothetical protein
MGDLLDKLLLGALILFGALVAGGRRSDRRAKQAKTDWDAELKRVKGDTTADDLEAVADAPAEPDANLSDTSTWKLR